MNKMPSNRSLHLFGKSIILRNMSIINSLYGIDSVVIPKENEFSKINNTDGVQKYAYYRSRRGEQQI